MSCLKPGLLAVVACLAAFPRICSADYDPYAPFYHDFSTFCLEHFGAEKEELVYHHFGHELRFLDETEAPGNRWLHRSVNSAAIAFSTTLPAYSWVEYGTTSDLSSSTEITDRHYYVHLHHMTGMQPGTHYYYRIAARDERGNVIYTELSTFTTETMASLGATAIPGGHLNTPLGITADGYYVLTGDIIADGAAISVTAQNVTLDLNGYSVLYDHGPAGSGNRDGVRFYWGGGGGSYRLLNGGIVQGQTQSPATSEHANTGANPVYSNKPAEVSGLHVVWGGEQLSGINLASQAYNSSVHHNVLVDTGTGISNRHYSPKAIYSISAASSHDNETSYNLIKRARAWGLYSRYGVNFGNEVYIDSYAPNGYGIVAGANKTTENNKVFGTGYNVTGLPWAFETHSDGTIIRNNFVQLQGDAPFLPDGETHQGSAVKGIRLTQYGQPQVDLNNYLIEDNTVVVYGKNGTTRVVGLEIASDPRAAGNAVRSNYVKAGRLDDVAPWGPRWGGGQPAACVVTHGSQSFPAPLLYENNVFVANVTHVLLGDYYTVGQRHIFHDNEFIRFGNKPDYVTVQAGYWIRDSYAHRFIDCVLGEGVSFDSNQFVGSASARLEYNVGHSLHIIALGDGGEPLGNTVITVADEADFEEEVLTDAVGGARLELIRFSWRAPAGTANPTRVNHDGHSLLVPGHPPYVLSTPEMEIRDNQDNPLTIIFSAAGWDGPGQPGLVSMDQVP